MVVGFLAGLIGGTSAGAILDSVQTRTLRGIRKADPVELLSHASYADAYRLGHITAKDYYVYMSEHGYDGPSAKLFYNVTKEFLSKEDAAIKRIANSFESIMNASTIPGADATAVVPLATIREEYCKAMYKLGYDGSESNKIFETMRPVPTFSILLEWLAKEVFEPEIRTRFQLDDDYPTIWASLMSALGVPESEAKAYWASHWIHPPTGQLGNMYTRFRSDRTNRSAEDAAGAGSTVANLEMSKADFTEALKLHEIAPYWRDRIIANSFRPIPFSALQQIQRYGTKTREWLKGRLEDYGYSAGNAEVILQTWERKYPPGIEAPLSTNNIKRYLRGTITRDACKAQFVADGLADATAEYVVSLADDKRQIAIEKQVMAAAKRKYSRNEMTDAQLLSLIQESITDEGRAARMAAEISAGKQGFFTRLRLRDITRGLSNSKITAEDARAQLETLRTQDADIDTLISLYSEQADA